MSRKSKTGISLLIVILVLLAGNWAFKKFNFNPRYAVGQKLDSLNGVYVYYNGGVNNVTERNTSTDGYNLGLKYQCVEFVKRYYYEHYNHKMPDAYGHAKDFFDKTIADGQKNGKRDLLQFHNPSRLQPEVGDLVIFSGTIFNRFGHVAIVAKVNPDAIVIIQQNPGPYGKSRETYPLNKKNGSWQIENDRVLGWLRKEVMDTIKAAEEPKEAQTKQIVRKENLKSIYPDIDGDGLKDTVSIVMNTITKKYGLKIVLAKGSTYYFGMGKEVLQQGFDDLNWVGIFEVANKGATVYNNVDEEGSIITEEEVREKDKIRLPNDGIFIHATESCGGGIIYLGQGKWHWVQQE